MSTPELSVVIPVLDEAQVIDALLSSLISALSDVGPRGFEIIVVDDGSTDDTWERIRNWHSRDPRIRGIALSRNFGHQAAVSAGLQESRGDAVAVMDGDMQDDPDDILTLLALHGDGHDVVYAIRVARSEASAAADKYNGVIWWWSARCRWGGCRVSSVAVCGLLVERGSGSA